MKLGAQLYSLRTFMQNPEDIRSTFLHVKEIGYENVQLSGAAPTPAETLKQISEETGMKIVCTHNPFDRIVNDTDALIAEHKTFGCPVIGVGSMPIPYRETLAGLNEFFRVMEEPVKKIEAAGLHFAYHNHSFEFKPFSDSEGCAYDVMLETKPTWHFIMDTCWVVYAGKSIEEYLRKAGADRLWNVHFKDFANDAPGTQFDQAGCKICPCGTGYLDFKPIVAVCEEIGVKHVLVEQDNAVTFPDPFGQMEESFRNLRPLIAKEN